MQDINTERMDYEVSGSQKSSMTLGMLERGSFKGLMERGSFKALTGNSSCWWESHCGKDHRIET